MAEKRRLKKKRSSILQFVLSALNKMVALPPVAIFECLVLSFLRMFYVGISD